MKNFTNGVKKWEWNLILRKENSWDWTKVTREQAR